MAKRTAQACQTCGAEIYFEGICYKCRAEKKRQEYLALNEMEIKSRIQVICERAEELDKFEDIYDDFISLFCFRGIEAAPVARAAAAKNIYYPDMIYYNAAPDTRDLLIERLVSTADSGEANHILCCLAMIGDDVVRQKFIELDTNPLPWREKLYLDPTAYAMGGGWTVDKAGNKEPLVYDTCYQLVAGNKNDDKAVELCKPRAGETCEKCGCQVMDMLSLDGRDERLAFLETDGVVKAVACPNCATMSEGIFCRYTLDGDSQIIKNDSFAEENYFDADAIKDLAANSYVLDRQPSPIFYGCGDDVVNTVGGRANWVQDFAHLNCPECGKHMKYFAQLQWDTVFDSAEGTLYFELCRDCRIIGMLHQQT